MPILSEIRASSLKDATLLSAAEVETFTASARLRKEPLWETLLREGKITEAWVADLFSKRLRLPVVSLPAISIDEEAVHRIPAEMARQHICLPFAYKDKYLHVAMVDPTNLTSIQDIEFFTGLPVRAYVTPRSPLLEAIEKHFAKSQALDFITDAKVPSEFLVLPSGEEIDVKDDPQQKAVDTPPIVKLANLIITEALISQASDVHIEPTDHGLRIRLRVDGVLRDYLQAPEWIHSGLTTRLKVMAKLDISEKRVPQDGRFKVRLAEHVSDIRLSTLPTRFGEKTVMRLLGSGSGVRGIGDLNLPADAFTAIVEATDQPQGMIIVTGPTGSGKSTTLYGLLGRRLSSEVNVVTVEDPIEYQLDGATQVQVNLKAGLTFATCLRSILRQDPDVILIGEVRDRETAEIAFHAAMTGHLVLTTLHTNNSIAAISRLLDLGIDPFAMTTSVTAIIAQRLARKICDRCREPYRPSEFVLEKLKCDDSEFHFTRGKGCWECHGTGFKGRVGVYEVLRLTSAVRTAINKRGSEEEIRKAAVAGGFVALLDDAREKIRAGLTTPDEILRVIQLKDEGEQQCCPKCSRPIRPESGKCMHCSEVSPFSCPGCGLDLDPTWRVCPRCAKGVPWKWPVGESPVAPTLPTDTKQFGKESIQ
jgi:type IV pilus assembly protein PilB